MPRDPERRPGATALTPDPNVLLQVQPVAASDAPKGNMGYGLPILAFALPSLGSQDNPAECDPTVVS